FLLLMIASTHVLSPLSLHDALPIYSRLRPRGQSQQRGQPTAFAHPAHDRGTAPRDDQGGAAQGRGGEGRDSQRAAQGKRGAGPAGQGRRGGRGRGSARGEGT